MAYIHLTSPLRRYADLVNQRILLAALSGQLSSYPVSSLDMIAEHLNRQEQWIEEEEKNYVLAEREKSVWDFLATLENDEQAALRLADMDAQAFYEMIVVLARAQTLRASVEQEIRRRFEQQLWQPRDLLTLVFRFQHTDEVWQRVAEIAIHALQKQPHHAISIFSLGKQILGWPEPGYIVEEGGPAHAKLFQIRASITLAGQDYTSDHYRGSQKERARQEAATALLASIAHVAYILQPFEEHGREPALLPLSQPQKNLPSNQPEHIHTNAKGIWNEIQQKRLATVVYSLSTTGPSPAPSFACTCLVTAANGYEIQGLGTGQSRKEAEQQAASQAIDLFYVGTDHIIQDMEKEKNIDHDRLTILCIHPSGSA